MAPDMAPDGGVIDSAARRAAERMLRAMGDPPVRLRLWNRDEVGAPRSEAAGTVHVRDRGALARLLADPDLAAGDLYTEGRIEIEGDLLAIVRALLGRPFDFGVAGRFLPRRLLRGVLRTDLAHSRANAQHHYDVGNEFYSLWLDERMLYTCAYFPTPQDTLEDAQLAKMDHVCRKVCLRPGQRVIEAGCGWGALALHMARYYGVTVRAFNVSHEQVAYAREQAEKQNLADRVEFIEDDYRNVTGRCDAFVSVGMLEHVGADHYRALGEVIERSLEPDGLALVHTIGRSRPARLMAWIERRVFPNAYPPTLREMMDIFEPRNFAVLDVENLRRHYALTARHWLARYERALDRCVALAGRERARAWRLYLAGAAASFELSLLQLFQVVATRARNDVIPWTRGYLYADAEAELGPTLPHVGGR